MKHRLAPQPHRRELTPISFIERSGEVHADRVAVSDKGRSYTYRKWRARSRRFASALRAMGLKRNDRVCFLAHNSEPLLLAHFAVPQAGGVLVAVNTRFTAQEVGYIVRHSGARFFFFQGQLESGVPDLPRSVSVCELSGEFEKLLLSGSDQPVESWLRDERDPIAINYTSGTTGKPKGAVYHHRGAYLNGLGMVIENRLQPDSLMLWTLPMFHCNGWSHTWATVAAGANNLCLDTVDPERIWALLESQGVTHFNGAPTVLIMLANHPSARRLARRIRVCTGGAPPSPTLLRQMDALNIEVEHLYGLTESYGPFLISASPPDDLPPGSDRWAGLKARQGLAHLTAGQAKVVDESGRAVPHDGEALGEVVLRGNVLMDRYYRDRAATSQAFRGGWFHTGDMGVIYPDGQIELKDRQKDIVISGGENISTIEVEQAIYTHPAVLEAAVVAAPDDFWGEVPKAFVTLKAGSHASEQEIIDHCRSRIAHFKCPKVVEFAELPKTSTGKIQKYLLRRRAASGPVGDDASGGSESNT